MRASSRPTTAAIVFKAALAGIAYLIAMMLSYRFGGGTAVEANIWIASGVAIAVLTLADRAHWLAYAFAIVLGSVMGNLIAGSSIGASLVYAIDEVVVAAVTAWALQRLLGSDPRLDDVRRVMVFVAVGALGGAVLGWLVAIPSYALLGLPSLASAWRLWIVSTGVGTLVIAPLLFAWSDFRPKRSGGATMADLALGGSLFVLLVAATLLVFAGATSERFSGSVGYALTYLPLPFLVLGGLVWGSRGATWSTFVMAAIAVLYTARGQGPFAGVEGFLGEAVVEVQGYVAAAALLTLMLSALDASRRLALRDAAAWRIRYEAVIGASDQLLYELDPASGRIEWAGDTARLLGTQTSAIASLAGYLERVHPADRDRLRNVLADIGSDDITKAATPHRFVSANGVELRLEGEANAIVDFDDSVHRVVGFLRPVRAAQSVSASALKAA